MNNSDIAWFRDLYEHGWEMPRAARWKRLPVIRHIRGAIARYRVTRHAHIWGSLGIGFGNPSQFDLWVAYGISTGRERPLQEHS